MVRQFASRKEAEAEMGRLVGWKAPRVESMQDIDGKTWYVLSMRSLTARKGSDRVYLREDGFAR